jgi:hypothetical protein
MPIFNNEYTFIHIPKCGGTSIEDFLIHNGYSVKLLKSKGHKPIYINGHTPQHCTFSELEQLGLLTDKIFTVAVPATMSLTQVLDLDALNANITANYVLSTFNVNDGGGTPVSYKIYTLSNAIPYSSDHRHQITIA